MEEKNIPIKFFKTPENFRTWFEKNHLKKEELWVGFYKKDSGHKSITWPASVDQALCFGWIDGLRKSIDEIRFTPRRKTSIWSNVNIKKIEELTAAGLMMPLGIKIFEERKEDKSGIYSFERKLITLDPAYEKIFKKNKQAWKWFSEQAPTYKKTVIWYVMSAKQEKTRLKRLDLLIKDCENGQKMKQYTWGQKEK